MTNFGFITVASAIPNVNIANCQENANEILQLIEKASAGNVQCICFPELSITGYTCADLFNQKALMDNALKALQHIQNATAQSDMLIMVGLPISHRGSLYNCAAILQHGEILAIVPKTYLPNHNEFYEKRWFVSAHSNRDTSINLFGKSIPFGTDIILSNQDFSFSVEICEDLWATIPPSSLQALAGSHIIFNLSASNELIGKAAYREKLIVQQSASCLAGYVYASAGFGESSTDLLYAGCAIIAENGRKLAENNRFSLQSQLITSEIDIQLLEHDRQKNSAFNSGLNTLPFNSINFRHIPFSTPQLKELTLSRSIATQPFVPQGEELDLRCQEIINIQATALAVRLSHTHIKSVILGISGGLDSTLALMICVTAFDLLKLDRKNIIGITMPGFGTTGRTYNNALQLMASLGITTKEINIKEACNKHFQDIEHDPTCHNITYENTQARIRTLYLMNLANKENALVIGTGDLSELALGWATYNGDHMSMYAVNTGIPKTLVKHLVKWTAMNQTDNTSKEILLDVVDTPISPELLPADTDGNIAQKTEEVVGPYILHDFFLYYMLRYGFTPRKIRWLANHAFAGTYSEAIINHWLKIFIKRFFTQQFKRSCMPDGPKVGNINLSPRGDWRMPSDADCTEWLQELD